MGVCQSTTLLLPSRWQPVLQLQQNRLSFTASQFYNDVYLALQPGGTPQISVTGNGFDFPNAGYGGVSWQWPYNIGGSTSWTMCLWFAITTSGSNPPRTLWQQYNAANNTYIFVNELGVGKNVLLGATNGFSQQGGAIAANSNLVCVVANGVSAIVYLNGAAVTAPAGALPSVVGDGKIPSSGSLAEDSLYCTDFRLYNSALVAGDITAIWNGGVQSWSAGPQTGLIQWLKMNEGQGSTCADSSGNSYSASCSPIEWAKKQTSSNTTPNGIHLSNPVKMSWVNDGELAWQNWYAYWLPGSNTQPVNPLTIVEWDSTVHLGDLPYSPNKSLPDFAPQRYRIQAPGPRLSKRVVSDMAKWMQTLKG